MQRWYRSSLIAALVMVLAVGLLPGAAGTPTTARSAHAQTPPLTGATKKGGKLSPRLNQLVQLAATGAAPASVDAQSVAVGLVDSGQGSLNRDASGRPIVDIRVSDPTEPALAATLAALKAAGAVILSVSPAYATVTVSIAFDHLSALAAVNGVDYVQEVLKPISGGAAVNDGAASPVGTATPDGIAGNGCNSIVSEADTQLKAINARGLYSIDGTGVTLGVLSDSFDTAASAATHAPQDVAADDLPGTSNTCGHTTPVMVQAEDPGCLGLSCTPAADEGRAMLQAVHDLAPGASLRFATTQISETDFAQQITTMVNAGVRVITDDWTFFDEPFFQDGPISNAVNAARAADVAYFSDAGNSAGMDAGHDWNGYESPAYRPVGCPPGVPFAYTPIDCHNFNPAGNDPTYGFSLAAGATILLDLQWAEPWYGVTDDFDLYLLTGTTILRSSVNDNITGSKTPVESISYTNTSGAPQALDVVIGRYQGSGTPRLKQVFFRTKGISAVEYGAPISPDFSGRQIIGHNGAAGAETVAATSYNDGVTNEYYSSHGPVTLYFNPVNGTTAASPLGSPSVLAKPDFTATDGGQNSFFGSGTPHRFYGTSQAAPQAAAIAALMRAKTPALTASAIDQQLKASAVAMNGAVTATGAGLIDAVAAIGTPVITSISPAGGAAAGGTAVTITGANFTTAGPTAVQSGGTAAAGIRCSRITCTTAVQFGALAATGVRCSSTSTCIATSPAGDGTVDVTATTAAGTSATSAADRFMYAAPCTLPAAADITSPAGGSISTGMPAFNWGGGACVTQYYLYAGNRYGTADLFSSGPLAGTVTSATISPAIPVDGRTIYVRLWSLVNGAWQAVDHSYVMGACANPSKADITAPTNGSIATGTPTFTWGGGSCVTQYYLYLGSTFGQNDLYSAGPLAGTTTSATVTPAIPVDGRTIYVRLWSLVNGGYQAVDRSYLMGACSNPSKADISSPLPGTIRGNSQTFTWGGGACVTQYYLYLGSTYGSSDLYSAGPLASTVLSQAVSGLPANGSTVYLRLWSLVNGTWQLAEHSYVTAP